MPRKMLIDATHAEETRVVVVDGNKVEEFDFETAAKRQLAGNIYLAKVTRVEPSLQAAFVDYGGNRHGFLALSEIHPDYYQIPTADRLALLEEDSAYAAEQDEDEGEKKSSGRKRRSRGHRSDTKAEAVVSADVVEAAEIEGMGVVDLGEETGADALVDAAAATPAGGDSPARVAGSVGSEEETDDDSYHAVDHAAEMDDEIESIAEEDVAEEIRQPRKSRPRKYKIQEVVKVRQIMLVQVVKEERGNKGAALTTYLSLAGRYCVLMPNTARGGGISRKITQAVDRKKLKEIVSEIEVPKGAGLIIRTAGAKRTKAEIKRDYEYLMRLWEQIRELTMKSIAPAPIYEEGNLIKRSIRDIYNREIDEVLVEGAEGYRVAKDFMKMIMPSHAKNVQQYADTMPLFARHQVESYLSGMFNPVVKLKSGGYIVIGVTEALVAIDVNSGRATKEGSIEDTATKTNMEAAEEIARQLRLRDLAGLIVIDFIDMEERRNNASVEKKLKDKLKTDRARIQVGRISGFGLMEMSRQRLRPGMLESTTQPCPHCHGTGLIRSDDSLALTILRALEEEGTRKRSKEVLLKAPIAIVNFLMNQKREHVAMIEARYGMAVRVEADHVLISPDFTIEKFRTATRVVEVVAPVVSIDTSVMPDLEDEIGDEDEAEVEVDTATEEADTGESSSPRKKRRRRRRRKTGGQNGAEGNGAEGEGDDEATEAEAPAEAQPAAAVEPVAETAEAATEDTPPRKTRSRTSRSRPKAKAAEEAAAEGAVEGETLAATVEAAEPPVAETPAKKTRSRAPRSRSKAATAPKVEEGAPAADEAVPATGEAPVRKTRTRTSRSRAKVDITSDTAAEAAPPVEEAAPAADQAPVIEAAPQPVVAEAKVVPEMAEAVVVETRSEPVPEPVHAANAEVETDADADDEGSSKPKRRGWWSLGR